MQIESINLNVQNNFDIYAKNNRVKKSNTLNNKKSSALNNKNANVKKSNSYIASLMNEKQLKEEQLEKMKRYREKHIQELEDKLSNIEEEIKDLTNSIKSSNENAIKKALADSDDEEDNDGNELANKSYTKDNAQYSLLDKDSIKEMDKNKLSRNLDIANDKVTAESDGDTKTDSREKSLKYSKVEELIKDGKIKIVSHDQDYIELAKLKEKCMAELETFKDNSKFKIESLEKEIRDINNKITKARQEKQDENSGSFIDLYV